MDEATSRLAMELQSVPTEIDEVQRRLMQLELAARQLAEETEEHAKDRLDEIKDEMDELRNKLASLREQWEAEKMGVGDVAGVQRRMDEARVRLRPAARENQRATGGRSRRRNCISKALRARSRAEETRETLRRSRRKQANADNANGAGKTSGRRLLRQEVGPDEIAEVVSAWTGIPVSRMLGNRTCKAARARRTPPPARHRPGRSRRAPSPTPSAAAASACKIRTARSARSFSAAPPASAKPSFARRWPKCCSTTKTPWSAST